MSIMNELVQGSAKMAVVGMGYVGFPLAIAFAEKFSVIGFDRNSEKIKLYQRGVDPTNEIGPEKLAESTLEFTDDPERLREARFIIIAVPTPIHGDKTPDLTPVTAATKTVGKYLAKGSLVVYESTVYPGVTGDICAPILERESGLACGKDFKIGYSPERINPGDKEHRLKNIVKIVSGMDEDSLEDIASVYGTVIDHVYRAPDIRVAEAAKLVENAQRDINIAFMNELAMVFHRMGINTSEVVKAMDTKWNSLGFRPGLVGGHCIGVDPYYFIYQAESLGYHSQIISSGRRINNSMTGFVVEELIKQMVKAKLDPSRSKVYLLGMTFKEDCADTRNSRSVDIYHRLQEYGLSPYAVDPVLNRELFAREYGIDLVDLEEVRDADCIVFLVAHREFRALDAKKLASMYHAPGEKPCIIFDVKNMYNRYKAEKEGYVYWSL